MHRLGRPLAFSAVTVALAVLLVGCSLFGGREDSGPAFEVGGLPVTDGPSGIRNDAPPPSRQAQSSDGSSSDELALLSIDDVEEFWRGAYAEVSGGQFTPVGNLLSYDSTDPNAPTLCDQTLYGAANAFYCALEDTMTWDRGVLIPTARQFFGDSSIAAMIAHEYGHAVQFEAGLTTIDTETIVSEQQADCFAGAYTRWVAEGKSPRFKLSTGEGLNYVLAGAITLRDPQLEPGDPALAEEAHGTALDRVSAFQLGFVSGVKRCAQIDRNEIEQRRSDLPLVVQQYAQTSETPVDQGTLTTLMDLLGAVFEPQSPPTLSVEAPHCPNSPPTPPASYCASSNTVSVDVPMLQQMSIPGDASDYMLPQGDNTAFSVVTSRYALALEHARDQPLDTPAAALRTACLTGVAQRAMAQTIPLPSGQSLLLTAGDLDEAVSGLLTNGLAASAQGTTIPAGFTRIEAFRTGLFSSQEQCFEKY